MPPQPQVVQADKRGQRNRCQNNDGNRHARDIAAQPGESRLRFDTGRPPLTTRANPRATVIIPSVTMNGATLPFVTTAPLTAPQAAPVKTPASTGTTTGYCGCPHWLPPRRSTPPATQAKGPRLRSAAHSHPHGQNAVDRDLPDHVDQVRHRQEIGFGKRQHGADHNERDDQSPRLDRLCYRLASSSFQVGMANFRISSWEVWRGSSSAVSTPSRITRRRSLNESNSGNSEEISRIALPARASRFMIA